MDEERLHWKTKRNWSTWSSYSWRNQDETSQVFLISKTSWTLNLKVQEQYKFECIPNPSEVSVYGIRVKWSSDKIFYLYVGNNIFNKYSLFKHQRKKGNKRKQLEYYSRSEKDHSRAEKLLLPNLYKSNMEYLLQLW